MLVIRRRESESFFVGNSVEIEILSVDGNQVKLGIRAPREIVILRKEVCLLRDLNRSSAAQGIPDNLANLAARLRK